MAGSRRRKKTQRAHKQLKRDENSPTPKKEADHIKIAAARGRPMLTWVGKRPLRSVTPFPAQSIESLNFSEPPRSPVQFNSDIWKDWPSAYSKGGLLFHGDNKEVLAHLLANGFQRTVKLIYIDPPFDSGANYVRNVKLRGPSGKVEIEGEGYSLGEQVQYTDIWANDNYLQFMFERLLLLKELLADGGAIFLHCDSTKGHHLRCLMEEVFGPEQFVNEIIWSYRRWPSEGAAFQAMHDTIFYYVNEINTGRTFHKQYEEASESYMKRFGGKTQILDEETRTRKITSDDETKGMPLRDVWDLSIVAGFKGERTGYPTQKPETLLHRIIDCCSNPGDLVLDCFIGSGTTAAVAQKLGRRWIGCDINKGAIQTSVKRLQSVIEEQMDGANTETLPGIELEEAADAIKPAQISFSVWRVNDYDLTIQQSEAVSLACEHIGITRTLSDSFFDGTLGQRLVKIIPFQHPLSLTDLEEVKRTIESRPNESRDVVVVCLGKELRTETWLADWNRVRKQGNTPNKIQIVELRSDPKYGKFFTHRPAKAHAKIVRTNGKLTVEVQDFISPTILERLSDQAGPLVKPVVTDWRSMVDSVMIDPAYDGNIFNIVVADIPERKDFVHGSYEISAPKGKTVVAVKITDMLGEEVILQREV